jgi:DNA-binding NarL/FixJ family response regulator
MAERIRVILADDHAVLRAGIRALLQLEPDMDVVAEVGTGEEAVERTRSLRPDVVVMDLGMPGIGGLEAIRQVMALGTGARVLVLTSHTEDEYLLEVLEAGGSGYVQKTHAEADLISAIRTVARDEVFLYPSATRLLLRGYKTAGEKAASDPLADLSDREREVMQLTAEGYGSGEIGKKLFLSPKTVDTYRYRLMQKLGLTTRAELVRTALEAGLLKAK